MILIHWIYVTIRGTVTAQASAMLATLLHNLMRQLILLPTCSADCLTGDISPLACLEALPQCCPCIVGLALDCALVNLEPARHTIIDGLAALLYI